MIRTIFETNSRLEILKRFLDNHSDGYTEFLSSLSLEYTNGISTLCEVLKDSRINTKSIEIASGYFAIATKEDKGKNRLLAYLGQIVCFYIMDNLFAIETLTRVILVMEPRIPVNIPTKLSLKGVSQNMLKGAGIITGGVLSFIPPLKATGIIITQAALRYQTENAVLEERPLDNEFYQLRNEIVSIEYERLHRMLR